MRKYFLVSFVCFFLSLSMSAGEAKYIFYFIGDGMGINQVLASEMYLAEMGGKIGRVPTHMSQFPFSGQIATFSQSNGITDSSAAGTCLATGSKTKNGTLGLTSDGKSKVETIAEQLHHEGYAVGVMTTVAIDHATPGAFYAHVPDRNMYYEIGTQLCESEFEFFGGAGFHQPVNQSEWQAPNLYDVAEKNGYVLMSDPNLAATSDEKRIILLPQHTLENRDKKDESLPYAIDRKGDALSLDRIVDAAIAHLSRFPRFFMMAEGGKIDYAGHGNDGATVIHETLDFDKAIARALAFYKEHPDETLIVVTADHETGGMALGCGKYVLNLQVLQHQHCSQWVLSDKLGTMRRANKHLPWSDVQALLEKELGLYGPVEVTEQEDKALRAAYKKMMKGGGNLRTMYKEVNAMSDAAVRLLNRKARLGWTSHDHTGASVPVFAIGVGAEQFSGWHDNSELAPLIKKMAR